MSMVYFLALSTGHWALGTGTGTQQNYVTIFYNDITNRRESKESVKLFFFFDN